MPMTLSLGASRLTSTRPPSMAIAATARISPPITRRVTWSARSRRPGSSARACHLPRCPEFSLALRISVDRMELEIEDSGRLMTLPSRPPMQSGVQVRPTAPNNGVRVTRVVGDEIHAICPADRTSRTVLQSCPIVRQRQRGSTPDKRDPRGAGDAHSAQPSSAIRLGAPFVMGLTITLQRRTSSSSGERTTNGRVFRRSLSRVGSSCTEFTSCVRHGRNASRQASAGSRSRLASFTLGLDVTSIRVRSTSQEFFLARRSPAREWYVGRVAR